ncbi:aldehyde dehydrogenase family protein [Kocuria dechangensis]|uniref:aldehyde dehydrogenase family protein n=1 Tax=Kocuria dechangensis TaxID=1176249 RepID=UPI00280C227D|nr:aldehyde dehydrogenase family protein [Kocuria dechangensis]
MLPWPHSTPRSSVWTPGCGPRTWNEPTRWVSQLEVGAAWINQHTVVELDAPLGGWKGSGLGRERGRWGLEEYLEPRTINARAPADVGGTDDEGAPHHSVRGPFAVRARRCVRPRCPAGGAASAG